MPYYSFLHTKDTNQIDPTYFNVNDFEWVPEIESSWKVIHNEVMDFINKNQTELKPYFATNMMNAPEKWKSFSFYFWGIKMSKNAITSCPKTINILKKIPNILSASVSIMEPNSEIKPHYGDTDAVFRCHLGLEIPEGLPKCGFRVGYEDRAWEQGKLMIFNDAAYHKAFNKTSERRIILLFDIIKPEYVNQKKWVCAMVRGNIIWQIITQPFSLISKKQNLFTKSMSVLLAVVVYFWFLSLNRKSSWL